MLNPECTPGEVVPDPAAPGLHAWLCGCGAAEGGFPSRTKAKRAQRDHRFPPIQPKENRHVRPARG